jgi:type I restriction enzyme M protein
MAVNLSQSFKQIDDILRKDDGLATALDYIEQTSWILFLKYFAETEATDAERAELAGKEHSYILDEKFRWSNWALPRTANGDVDHDRKLLGDDLINFVNQELFPYLKSLRDISDDQLSMQYKVGEIFGDITNRIRDGYNLREIIEIVDQLKFRSLDEQHEMSELYEGHIQQMGNAGRNGGEYYTPRSLIRAMIAVLDPKVGETIYDPACGSGGFLVESYKYLLEKSDNLSTNDMEFLQTKALLGKEKKGLPFIIANMHLIFNGIKSPNIVRANTLSKNVMEIQEKDRVDIILANPPFGGKENESVQMNFPIKTSASENMFMQYFIKNLKQGGRAAIIIKNTFLTNDDNATKALRQELLTECNLHTILDMPQGTFLGAGVKTVVLFFTKGEATKDIWYYQLDPNRSLGKTNPLNINDFKEFLDIQSVKTDSDNSWAVKYEDLDQDNYDLGVNNPNKVEEVDNRTPQEIIAEIEELDAQAAQALKAIKELL